MDKQREYDGWDYGQDWIKVDGLTPSEEMMKLIERERKGEITEADVKKALEEKYRSSPYRMKED